MARAHPACMPRAPRYGVLRVLGMVMKMRDALRPHVDAGGGSILHGSYGHVCTVQFPTAQAAVDATMNFVADLRECVCYMTACYMTAMNGEVVCGRAQSAGCGHVVAAHSTHTHTQSFSHTLTHSLKHTYTNTRPHKQPGSTTQWNTMIVSLLRQVLRAVRF